MLLCFGTFAKILNLCNLNMPQDRFVPKVAWVVDRLSSSLGSNLEDEDIVDDPAVMEGNKAVVSRLLSCERPLKLRDEQLPSLAVTRERFKSKVMPYINEDKIAGAVMSVLYLIKYDDTIDEEHRESFRKHLGVYKEELLCQTTFDVPDFFARILLYTTCVDNKKGKPYAKDITEKFIEETKTATLAKIKWNVETQKVEIVYPELSEEIEEFSEKIRVLSELRLALIGDQMNFSLADTSWLGEGEGILFPKRYTVEFRDPAAKKAATDKLVRCMKLARECCDYFQSARAEKKGGQRSLFPEKRMQNARQQFTALYDELFFLAIFPDRFSPEQEAAHQ